MFLFWCVICVSSLHGVLSQAQLVQPSSEVKKPAESVKLLCKTSGFTFTSYYIHWIQQVPGKGLTWVGRIDPEDGQAKYSSSFKGRFTMTTDNSISTAYLQIDRLSVEDSATYYCAKIALAGTSVDIWGPGQYLDVTSAGVRGPSVFPLVPCCDSLHSDKVSIGCLSTGYSPTPVNVQWNSGSITNGIRNFPAVLGNQGTYLSASLLTIPASDWTSDKKFVCNVNHTPSGTKVDKQIEACQSKASEPTVSVMQASCGESGSVDLVCLISQYAPKDINVQWLLNGEPTSIIPKNTPAYKEHDGTFGSRSKVSVPKNDWNSGDRYTCKVNHPASKTKHEASIQKCPAPGNVIPKVTLLPPSPKDILITKQPKLTCQVSQVESPDTLTIKWTREDGKRALAFPTEPEIDYSGLYTIKSSLKLSLPDWESGKKFTCTVQNDNLPTPIEKTIKLSEVKSTDPVVILFPPPPEEILNQDFVDLVCVIKRFNPRDIYVQWLKNGAVQNEEYYTNTEPVLQDDETYNMFSTLTIEKSDWNRGATFTCNAVHNKITSKEIKKTRGK